MKRCEECSQLKSELPCLYVYWNKYTHENEERKTCYDCRKLLNRKLRVIAHGPMVKRNKVRYHMVTVAGEPISGQLELF